MPTFLYIPSTYSIPNLAALKNCYFWFFAFHEDRFLTFSITFRPGNFAGKYITSTLMTPYNNLIIQNIKVWIVTPVTLKDPVFSDHHVTDIVQSIWILFTWYFQFILISIFIEVKDFRQRIVPQHFFIFPFLDVWNSLKYTRKSFRMYYHPFKLSSLMSLFSKTIFHILCNYNMSFNVSSFVVKYFCL